MKKLHKTLLTCFLSATTALGVVGMASCNDGDGGDATTYTVTINQNMSDVGYVVGAKTYEKDEQATLMAAPKTGYRFVGWYDGTGTCVSAQPGYTFAVTKDTTLTAVWEVGDCNVVVNKNMSSAGNVTGAGAYAYGSEVTLTATSNNGYTFEGWYDGETYLSGKNTIAMQVLGDKLLTAKWKPITETSAYTWHDGTTKEENYREEIQTKYFFSDRNDAVTYFANAMYEDYGDLTPSNQPYVGEMVGWTPAWFEWIVLTRNWSNNEFSKNKWREYIINQPIMPNGFVWAYDSPHWPDMGGYDCGESPDGNCHNYHYDSNFRYIISICNYVGWENSLDILDEVDTNQEPNHIDSDQHDELAYHLSKGEDASMGLTLGEKLDRVVSYVLNDLEGRDGMIIIDEDDNDGRNLGTSDSYSCNYWDNIPFGYKSAYENILFYNSLKSLVDLETFRGNDEKAAQYSELMEKVKTRYNETFWSEETGRYIACVDKNGIAKDYGVTFVNTEAVTAGLASEEQAKSIYDWLDGYRIVEGDQKKGEELYGARKSGGVSLITNTINFGVSIDGAGAFWHDNGGSQALSGNGAFGEHVENGGSILYTEYYDIMGRLYYGDVASAYGRMEVLAREYAIDELNRDPLNTNGTRNLLGFVGEFPESGLVPTAYLYGFIGLSLMPGGLRFNPQIPDGYEYMGANDVCFQGQYYKVTTYKDGKFTLESGSDLNMLVALKDVSSKGTRTLTFYDVNGTVITTQQITAQDGEFTLDMRTVPGAVKAVLA